MSSICRSNCLKSGAFAAILTAGVSMAAMSAHAEVIINPDQDGSIYVSPNLATTPNSTNQINVGFSGNSGTVEINAAASGNGHTAISGSGLLVGNGAGAVGAVRIIGDGTSGSASATINNGIGARIGFGGTGRLELRSGGTLESNENINLGEESLSGNIGDSTVIVDGAGSVLRSTAKSGSFGGGRLYVPFGQANANLTVSNGGLVDAVGGNIAAFEDGSIYIGNYTQDFLGDVEVNIDGVGSTMRAQHGIYVLNELGGSTVNITNGGLLQVTDVYPASGGDNFASMSIGSLTADGAQINVRNAGSSISMIDGIDIGNERAIIGFSAGGEPRSTYSDTGKVAGDQVVNGDGDPIFKANGDPLLFVEVDLGGFTLLVPENYDIAGGTPNYVKATGHMLVEDGATVTSGGDINISTNNADASVQPLSGQESSLTVRSGGQIFANTVSVNEGGVLNGADGVINADVELNGGTLAPGNSPGTMTILGDLILNDGLLELEIGDLLDVSGDIFLGSDVMIDLIFGSDPVAGDSISLLSFFDFDGSFVSNFDPFNNLRFSGLSNNAFFTVVGFGNEQLVVGQAGGDPTGVPEPAALALFGIGLAGLGAFARRRRAAA